jgi:hypothetical protein
MGGDVAAVRDRADAVQGLGFRHATVHDHVVGAAHRSVNTMAGGPDADAGPHIAELVAVTS